jgi:hypothetical protein
LEGGGACIKSLTARAKVGESVGATLGGGGVKSSHSQLALGDRAGLFERRALLARRAELAVRLCGTEAARLRIDTRERSGPPQNRCAASGRSAHQGSHAVTVRARKP